MGQPKVVMSNNSSSLRYVDHTYRDFSRYVEEGGELVKHKKSGNNFPARLHKILSASDPGHSDVITWMVSAGEQMVVPLPSFVFGGV
jgi:hypothetical protein